MSVNLAKINKKSKRVKIDVYLSEAHKDEIQRRAEALDLSVSDYMKLKALDLLKEGDVNE